MKKLFSKIRNRKFLLWLLVILIGIGNTIFYSVNYYQQSGLEFNLINSISIDWNIIFNAIVLISNLYLITKNNKSSKKIEEACKVIENTENNIMNKSIEVENFVMELLKKLKG